MVRKSERGRVTKEAHTDTLADTDCPDVSPLKSVLIPLQSAFAFFCHL